MFFDAFIELAACYKIQYKTPLTDVYKLAAVTATSTTPTSITTMLAFPLALTPTPTES